MVAMSQRNQAHAWALNESKWTVFTARKQCSTRHCLSAGGAALGWQNDPCHLQLHPATGMKMDPVQGYAAPQDELEMLGLASDVIEARFVAWLALEAV